MAKTKIEFEVDIPEGYEYTGEYRKIRQGETYLNRNWQAEVWEPSCITMSLYPVLRKTEVWKQLTPEKALEFMLSHKTVTMRHMAWGKGGRVQRQTIEGIYNFGETSIDMPDNAHISNVEYLEQDV